VSWREELTKDPWAYDFYWILGRHEALHPDKPRIGDSTTRRDEYIDLGQEPYLAFPAANIASYDPGTATTKARMRSRFLGMLGPMGPLPITTTEEALRWFRRHEDAFVRFLDIFNNRFLQLFYRAQADARPAGHMRQPATDRFRDYVGSTIGIGTESWRDLDTMPDYRKLAYAGLLGPRIVSASRIEHLISGLLNIRAEVEEFIGSYLPVAPEEQTRVGQAHAGLGTGAMAGQKILTVDTTFRLSLYVASLREYENFLPGGHWADQLVDALSNAVGFEYDWEVELVLPREFAKPAELGSFGRLGWTTWVPGPGPEDDDEDEYVRTRFSPISDGAAQILN